MTREGSRKISDAKLCLVVLAFARVIGNCFMSSRVSCRHHVCFVSQIESVVLTEGLAAPWHGYVPLFYYLLLLQKR